MPSPAASRFFANSNKAKALLSIACDHRLKPIPSLNRQVCLHGAVASYVSFWDSYVKGLAKEFYTETSDPFVPKYHGVHTLLQNRMDEALGRLNTPNSENARNFLIIFTGYDPINDWVWPRRSMNGLAVRERLNEIFKLRHSFAHGHQMPSYRWNTLPSGRPRLTVPIVRGIEAFFINLVHRTDKGMRLHIATNYNPLIRW